MRRSILFVRRARVAVVLMCVAVLGPGCASPGLQTSDAILFSPTAVAIDRPSSQATLTTPASVEPRSDVITYVVQTGDNILSIADKFGLQPETVLWANEAVLRDNPRNIKPGVELTILPVDGVLYRWHLGDDLAKVAEHFSAKPEDILNWPGNQLDPQDLDIAPGTALIIPGGLRPLTDSNGITIHMSSDPTPQP